MKVVITLFILFNLLQSVYSLETWQENYEGAYFVLPTLLIFAIVFGVLILLSIVFAVVLTVRERMNKSNTHELSNKMDEIIMENEQNNQLNNDDIEKNNDSSSQE